MNLDFSADPQFSWYVVLLLVSGVAMIALSFAKSQGNVGQLLNAIFGTLFVGYGIYLAFIFDGGSYWMFFQAFILPVLLVFQWVKSLGRSGNRSA
ncbi:hypothetical protein OG203_12940 [Nocardia sp. NBC_01499]|uniref:hypothetical protein n=1 Tax=Nocardia sp. NBC_01499 TaxID=2903597 RepID=UPI00386356E3